MSHKILVIGLDGATDVLLKPWMDAGLLPHLKEIADRGVQGPLRSSIPPVTSPAWPCFMTGKNPGKHGLTWFLGRLRGSYDEIPLDSTSIDSKTFWEILSEAGKKVAVLNVPTTYPVRPVNGVMISGFLTPPGKRDFVHPPELLEAIEQRFGPYQMDLKTPPFLLIHQTPEAIAKILQDAHELLEYKFSVAEYVMETDDFDFFMLHLVEPDRLQHWLWNLLDPSHPRCRSDLAEPCRNGVFSYFQALDRRIGALVSKAGSEATVIVLSDHGFGPCHKAIDLNAWLLQEGYLRIKPGALPQLKYYLWRNGWNLAAFAGVGKRILRSRLVQDFLTRNRSRRRGAATRLRLKKALSPVFLSHADIDWHRTRAYCLTGYGQIRINLVGREPQGMVQPGEKYEQLRDEIVGKLKGLVDPETGEPIGAQVFSKEEIYRGKHAAALPDITFLPEENNYIAHTPMSFVGPRVVVGDIELQGYHRMEGILFARGPWVREGGTVERASIMDLAPTILYLLDSQIPDDMDGKVLTQILKSEFLDHHPIEFMKPDDDRDTESSVLSKEDEESIIERLKGLGYLS